MKDWVFRLTHGTDLRAGIEAYAADHAIRAAIVTAAVGCVDEAVLRLADGRTQRRYRQRFEIVALSGTLSSDGSHLHVALADQDGQVIGGHLAYGTKVNTTCELALRQLDDEYEFRRRPDPATGYNELEVIVK